MVYLLFVSLIWAFSFGLIKSNLTGIDSNFVACTRLLISFIVFAPFLRLTGIDRGIVFRLVLIGMFQYGIMYITYIYSYHFLQAHEVALFTIFTPLYVTLISDYLGKSLCKLNLFTAFLAVIGTGIVVYNDILRSDLLQGFFILQLSNLCFAFGQVYYKETMSKAPATKDLHIFGLLFFGASIITAFSTAVVTEWSDLSLESGQVLTLFYLGLVASGLGFFLWNYGARRVDVGTLAIFNNLKVPLAISVSILFFGEQANMTNYDTPHISDHDLR